MYKTNRSSRREEKTRWASVILILMRKRKDGFVQTSIHVQRVERRWSNNKSKSED
jgi:hypothetical protein